MAIYLTQEERDYLLFTLQKSTWWIAKSIVGKVQDDIKRLEGMEVCEHVPGEYVTTKKACVKCGAYYEPGMGFTTTLKEGVCKQQPMN